MAETLSDRLDREALTRLQSERLRALLAEILPANRFYARKFAEADAALTSSSPTDLTGLPFTTKHELCADQELHPPYGEVLTYATQRYCRMHQTSGTSGKPLRWLDTPESWRWLLDCWETIYRIIGLRPGDRLFFAFSFGPFLGFWTAFDAANRLGYLCLAGGGMSSSARVRFLLENAVTVVLCTPTYALRLAEVAEQEGLDLAGSHVRALIVAGEPGGSIEPTRRRLETAWDARVFDHNGLTEVGAVGVECPENPNGLHVLESDYIVEVIDPRTTQPVAAGSEGELAITNLGRLGSPLIRYRTGDVVKVDERPCPCGRALIRLDGGILGRTDEMIHLRGNNVYPSAIEAVLRRFAEVAEYRVEIDMTGPLAELRVQLEPAWGANGAELAERVGRAIRDEFLFRAEVTPVERGTLPRFEMKARRVVRKLKIQN